jgi:hypothetical protein
MKIRQVGADLFHADRRTDRHEEANSRFLQSSCLHRASIVSKTLFIVPTDAHYYKIIEMLKQFKIVTLAPTCFGSRRNHHHSVQIFTELTTAKQHCVKIFT